MAMLSARQASVNFFILLRAAARKRNASDSALSAAPIGSPAQGEPGGAQRLVGQVLFNADRSSGTSGALVTTRS
jgi:hypothetical protein